MNFDRAKHATHVLLRIAVGFLFLQHGGQKLFGWFGGTGGDPGQGVALMSQMGLAGILEFYGGIAIVLGLFTRPVAFLLSGEMAVAYFIAHQPRAAWPIQNHGDLALLLSFSFLFLAAHGAGGLSFDALFRRGRERSDGKRSRELRSREPRSSPGPSPVWPPARPMALQAAGLERRPSASADGRPHQVDPTSIRRAP